MVHQLDVPALLVLLSASGIKQPNLIRCLGKLIDQEYIDKYIKKEMTWAQKRYLIASYPAVVSRYFNNCVQKLFKCVLYSQHSPLGTVKDFFITLLLTMW